MLYEVITMAMAGIQIGDVILEVNRVTITSVSKFYNIFSRAKGRVLLLLYRQGATLYLLLEK